MNSEKVFKGLECCKANNFDRDYDACDRCSYNGLRGGEGCVSLYADALTLLEEQKEQIKNRDESLEKAREEIKWLRGMLKEQEAVKPRVSSVEQRCGNCNKVIEMDGWIACPWCGKPIAWNEWWNKNGGIEDLRKIAKQEGR